MENRGEKAKALFMQGYNCSQAVVGAFADLLDEDEQTLYRIADGFGGGLGRLRLTCGGVAGMAILAGLRYSSGKPGDLDNRTQVYQAVRKMAAMFEEKNGSIICRDLLGALAEKDSGARPEERTAEYYKTRPCPQKIADCALIAERVLFSSEE